MTTHPRGSVLIRSDFTGASFDEEAIRIIKESAVFDRPSCQEIQHGWKQRAAMQTVGGRIDTHHRAYADNSVAAPRLMRGSSLVIVLSALPSSAQPAALRLRGSTRIVIEEYRHLSELQRKNSSKL